MNAQGMIVVLTAVSGNIGMAFFQDLVTDGSIGQDELDGTRSNLAATIVILKATPADKIEAMVDQYNSELSSYLNNFNSPYTQGTLSGFRDVQVMLGFVTSIMNKSGIKG